jgi:hypothetical protein
LVAAVAAEYLHSSKIETFLQFSILQLFHVWAKSAGTPKSSEHM